jgi:hypothetical protein
MDPLFMGLLLVALFLIFLMLVSGRRRHVVIKAMQQLETERLKLKKSIEHVKLSFYQKKLSEEEAQAKIFGYEEELKVVEERITELKEVPLARTLRKQQGDVGPTEEEKEEVEGERSERFLLTHLDSKTIVLLFIVVIAVAIFFVVNSGDSGFQFPGGEGISLDAEAVPEKGTYPGGTGGVRIEIRNNGREPVEDLVVGVEAPDNSRVHFEEGQFTFWRITELEAGGTRQETIPVLVDHDANEGEYVLKVRAVDAMETVNETATAKLIVSIGSDREI